MKIMPLLLPVLLISFHLNAKTHVLTGVHPKQQQQYVCHTDIAAFTTKFSKFASLKDDLRMLYDRDSSFIWYDRIGITEHAMALYNNALQLDKEGLPSSFPYKNLYTRLFYADTDENEVAPAENELLISSLYLFYLKKVYHGLDAEHSRGDGWFLPRKKTAYGSYRDSIVTEPPRDVFFQYNNLKKALKKYMELERKGGWQAIEYVPGQLPLYPGDTARVIAGIRSRLFIEGYLQQDSGSKTFDTDLAKAIATYCGRQFIGNDSLISAQLIKELNVNVRERLRCIAANMERCRWVSPNMNSAQEYIAVNIPSFRLHYYRDGKPYLISKVIVGKQITKTVVFSGTLQHIVFSPYWNIPNSILRNEILPDARKDQNYYSRHEMEWVGSRLRQRPGPSNPLGLVKFVFPNNYNIYLHDTPAKSLFAKDDRAFSHGCIRVERARELALAIMEKEGRWSEEKVLAAMASGREKTYVLEKTIPVYIAYFTAWADEEGNIGFFEDIYDRDARLEALLFGN